MREILYCDCCGKAGMAIRREDKLVITRKSHSKLHTLTIPLSDLTQNHKPAYSEHQRSPRHT